MTAAALAPAGERCTDSAHETGRLGFELAAALVPGDLVALSGDLGTGKTCMIQSICAALGVTEVVSSPTFVLLNVYQGRRREGVALTVYHFDLYRLGSRGELEDIGAEEFFHDRDAVCLVEWADRVPELLPAHHWEVHLEHAGAADERHIRWRRRPVVAVA